MTDPEKKTQPEAEAEETQTGEIQDEDLEEVTGGALNISGTTSLTDLRSLGRTSIRLDGARLDGARLDRIKKITP